MYLTGYISAEVFYKLTEWDRKGRGKLHSFIYLSTHRNLREALVRLDYQLGIMKGTETGILTEEPHLVPMSHPLPPPPPPPITPQASLAVCVLILLGMGCGIK